MALLRVRDDPHLVVVPFSNTIMAMVLGSRLRDARLVRLRPLSRAVPLSHAARPSCGGMRRVSGLGGGAARSRPPVLGAGLGSVSVAMSVCTQPRCGTHTPPLAGWWVFNHQIHASTRSSETCAPGLTSAWSCRTKTSVVAACGRGTTAKSLFGWTSRMCSRRAATSSLEGVEAWMP